MTRRAGVWLVLLALAPVRAAAQAPARPAAPAPVRPASPLDQSVVVNRPPAVYDDGGRRDPFVSLIAPKPAPKAGPVRPLGHGLAALSVADVVVQGILQTGATAVAILQGPDGKTFLAHPQDRLEDGSVQTIDGTGVVFVQQVADAGGTVTSRQVRKGLRRSGVGR